MSVIGGSSERSNFVARRKQAYQRRGDAVEPRAISSGASTM
jgi:hypothetical protein